jgi:ubiquitin carboxyl-terminal hydrolase L3
MSANRYQKHFIPLESNPDVFTQLIHDLGVSPTLSFKDVLTLDEPALFPRPALALILIFPTSETYEAQKAKEAAVYEEGSTDKEDVVWFKQTINNACGLYAILHAVCNGDARDFIRKLEDFV